jgi:decaprenylphospho-beta-D-erythro-pentofuranosid-2-ulose 2-reductase
MKDALGNVQSVLLLGGTSDIGQAIVRELLVTRGSARAVLASRDPRRSERFADELRRAGVTVELLTFDADDPASHRTVLEQAAAGGDLDVIVLAWGVLGAPQSVLDDDPAAAAAVARTNYDGVVSAGLAAAQILRRQGHGTVVYLSSVAGERVRKANFVYGSTKAAADAFMQGLGDSLAGSGARALIVRPGFVSTKMTTGMKPMPLSTSADRVAAATVKALRGSAAIAWVPWPLRYVFSVFRHLPRFAWRRLPL